MFIEHPVIFIGYSITDKNIREIIESIAGCLDKEMMSLLQDRLIFVDWKEDKSEATFYPSYINIGSTSVPVHVIETNGFIEIFRAMSSIERKMPASLLRRIKDHVYSLILNNDHDNRIYVTDFDKSEAKDIDVVLGVGAIKKLQEKRYSGIKRSELFSDVLNDKSEYDSNEILSRTIDDALQGSVRYVPIFKYLRKSGRISKSDIVDTSGLSEKVKILANRTLKDFATPSQKDAACKVIKECGTIDTIIKRKKFENVTMVIPYMNKNDIDIDVLYEAIIKRFDKYSESKNKYKQTSFFKLICIYDYIKYGPSTEKTKSDYSCIIDAIPVRWPSTPHRTGIAYLQQDHAKQISSMA